MRVVKEEAPPTPAAMEKLLTKSFRKKFLAVGELKEVEKKKKIGDKVVKKKVVVMSDAAKSSLLYLGEDAKSCMERLRRVMAVAAEAVQLVATELSLCGSICQLCLSRLSLRPFVVTSPQRVTLSANLVFKTLRQQLLRIKELQVDSIELLDVTFKLPRNDLDWVEKKLECDVEEEEDHEVDGAETDGSFFCCD